MLEYINEELQAKERCASFHKSVEEQCPQKKNLYFIASNLHTQQEQSQQQKGRCVFCIKNDHPPSQCKQVTNIKSRVDIQSSSFEFCCTRTKKCGQEAYL